MGKTWRTKKGKCLVSGGRTQGLHEGHFGNAGYKQFQIIKVKSLGLGHWLWLLSSSNQAKASCKSIHLAWPGFWPEAKPLTPLFRPDESWFGVVGEWVRRTRGMAVD